MVFRYLSFYSPFFLLIFNPQSDYKLCIGRLFFSHEYLTPKTSRCYNIYPQSALLYLMFGAASAGFEYPLFVIHTVLPRLDSREYSHIYNKKKSRAQEDF